MYQPSAADRPTRTMAPIRAAKRNRCTAASASLARQPQAAAESDNTEPETDQREDDRFVSAGQRQRGRPERLDLPAGAAPAVLAGGVATVLVPFAGTAVRRRRAVVVVIAVAGDAAATASTAV